MLCGDDFLRYGRCSIAYQLRELNVSNIAEVDTAILETGGRVSVLKKGEYAPVVPSDFNMPVVENGLPAILVNDGKVIEKNLKYLGRDESWLKDELLKYGVENIKNVYLATVDSDGKIYYSLVE